LKVESANEALLMNLLLCFSSHNGIGTVGRSGQNEPSSPIEGVSEGALRKVRFDSHDTSDAQEEHHQSSALHGLAGSAQS